MSLFDKIVDAATGGLGSDIVKTVSSYFPPNMSEEQKENLRLAAANLELTREKQVAATAVEAEKNVTDRIAQLEGTATDLKGIPVLGPIMLFLRGAQRPVWGFATIYLDYCVFSGSWQLTDPVIINCFYVLNFLVLGFLFGERAIMNVLPLVTQLLAAKKVKE